MVPSIAMLYPFNFCTQLKYTKYCYSTLIILFNTIYSFVHYQMVPSIAMLYQFNFCTQLKYTKYCYSTLIILFNTIYSFVHYQMVSSIAMLYQFNFCTVKVYQILLFNSNNSIQHYSFVPRQLSGSSYYVIIIVTLKLQFNIGHFFVHSEMVKQFSLTHR